MREILSQRRPADCGSSPGFGKAAGAQYPIPTPIRIVSYVLHPSRPESDACIESN